MAVAMTWAQEWRMRSSSVIFCRSSKVFRSFIKVFLTADERRWTQIIDHGGAAGHSKMTAKIFWIRVL
jgi:hypothetical protein